MQLSAPLCSAHRTPPTYDIYLGIVWKRSQPLAAIFHVRANDGTEWSRLPILVPCASPTRPIRRFRRCVSRITAKRDIICVSLVYRLRCVWAPLGYCPSPELSFYSATATSSERLEGPKSYFAFPPGGRKGNYSLRRAPSLPSASRQLERDTSGLILVSSQTCDEF